ncbi:MULTISPECIES: glycosyl hydrolase family 28-related protein [unclassified Rhizobium]|uniref:glycosyl hydrolase family 28-related protein n=1 Tax=unclassified Rhizobium TaxID=2613769 RepID=UPI00380430F7
MTISDQAPNLGAPVAAQNIAAQTAINVRDYGATGDGTTDDTAALNNALEAAFQLGKTLYIPKGVYRLSEVPNAGRCLLNKGVSMFGDAALESVFAPVATLANTVDMMHFYPVAGADFCFIERTAWWPGYPNFDTNVRGKRPIHFVWDGSPTVSSSKLILQQNYFMPSNDLSFEMECNPTIIVQGSPSNSLICDNHFWGGIKLSNCGDSNVIARNVIRAPVSQKAGIAIFTIAASDGTAGHNVIRDNNIDSTYGPAIYLFNGREYIIDGNNIEHRVGGGSASAAVIDVDGTSGTIPGCRITNNRVAIFGASTAQTALRLNGCSYNYIAENTLDTNVTRAQAILLTPNSSHARLGRTTFNGPWTQQINNVGFDNLKINYVSL